MSTNDNLCLCSKNGMVNNCTVGTDDSVTPEVIYRMFGGPDSAVMWGVFELRPPPLFGRGWWQRFNLIDGVIVLSSCDNVVP